MFSGRKSEVSFTDYRTRLGLQTGDRTSAASQGRSRRSEPARHAPSTVHYFGSDQPECNALHGWKGGESTCELKGRNKDNPGKREE